MGVWVVGKGRQTCSQRSPRRLTLSAGALKELVQRGWRKGAAKLRRWQRSEKLRFRSWHRRHSSESYLAPRLLPLQARWPQESNPSAPSKTPAALSHFRILRVAFPIQRCDSVPRADRCTPFHGFVSRFLVNLLAKA